MHSAQYTVCVYGLGYSFGLLLDYCDDASDHTALFVRHRRDIEERCVRLCG